MKPRRPKPPIAPAEPQRPQPKRIVAQAWGVVLDVDARVSLRHLLDSVPDGMTPDDVFLRIDTTQHCCDYDNYLDYEVFDGLSLEVTRAVPAPDPQEQLRYEKLYAKFLPAKAAYDEKMKAFEVELERYNESMKRWTSEQEAKELATLKKRVAELEKKARRDEKA